jgi:two-component system cell cycle sensor histidine kinase/response regulator CckA
MPELDGLRLLLVEDDEDDFVLTRALLEDAGRGSYVLRWAGGMDEGLAALAAESFDAVLLDYRLGGHTALDFLARLPEDGSAPPVVLLTGQDDHALDVAAMRAGAVDFLVKPEITPPLLERAVRYAVERRRAEEALLASERRFRALVDNSPEAVSVLGAEGEITYQSAALERMMGYTAREMEGTLAFAYIHPTDLAPVTAAFRALLDRPRDTIRLDYRVRTRQGEWRVFESFAHNLLDEPGVRGVVVNSRDVTDRRRAEAALRESETRFRTLFESAGDGMAIHDLDGRFVDVNACLCENLGYARHELLGMRMADLDLNGAAGPEAHWRALSPGRAATFESAHRRRDGSVLPVEVKSSIIELGGRRLVLAIVRDVSERRELEEQLRQAQKMEAVGRLAGGIAHDFNNLLTAIKGSAEMLLMDLPLGSVHREDATEIERAAGRAAELTRQLLAFSRKQVLVPTVLDLNAAVRDMERMLRRMIGEHVELVTELDPALARVTADPGQVEQMLMNLAVNARDAMPGGGRLTIATAGVELGAEEARRYPYRVQPGAYVRLTVSDTGTGMDEATLARIFEPFFTTKEKGRGTGLGLSTVYGIVKQSGGYVWADSRPGRGSTFTVYLPATAAQVEPAAPRLAGGEHAPGRASVLLVEDEDAVRSLVRRILDRAGYRVVEASGPAQARTLFEEGGRRFDLLLTDVVMPGGSGRDLARDLAAARPGLAVLFMSGYTDDALFEQGMAATGGSLIEKPFDPEVLIRRVGEAVSGAGRAG